MMEQFFCGMLTAAIISAVAQYLFTCAECGCICRRCANCGHRNKRGEYYRKDLSE